jgi:AraC-like DNA-binding protein
VVLLDQLMKDLHVAVAPFAVCEIADGSQLLIGDLGWVTVHFVLAGSGRISMGRRPGLDISKYSLVLAKRRHTLRGSGTDGTPIDDFRLEGVERLVGTPPGDPDFIVACGRIQATYGQGIGLFDGLDDPIIADFADSKTMRLLFEMILEETTQGSEGSLGIIEALMRQCLILLLRHLKDTGSGQLAFLEGLNDKRMSAVIADVLKSPDHPHSVQSMAETAMMSRSAFATRFRECFNETPMTFVRKTRLRRAAEMLRTTQTSIRSIASVTGFASRSHFSQTFTREYGITPSDYRATVTAEPTVEVGILQRG